MVIFTEFQNPGARPWQFRPVQALLQALTHASKLGACGKAKILPKRISGMVLSEVTTIT